MPNKPSPKKFVRDYLLRHAFYDKEKDENVNACVARETLRAELLDRYENMRDTNKFLPEWLSDTLGEVLTDNRGRGFMQS